MNARSLLHGLKSFLEMESIGRAEPYDMQIEGTGPIGEATVSFFVEGKIKVIRVFAIEVGFFDFNAGALKAESRQLDPSRDR